MKREYSSYSVIKQRECIIKSASKNGFWLHALLKSNIQLYLACARTLLHLIPGYTLIQSCVYCCVCQCVVYFCSMSLPSERLVCVIMETVPERSRQPEHAAAPCDSVSPQAHRDTQRGHIVNHTQATPRRRLLYNLVLTLAL